MPDNILAQITNLRNLFFEATPDNRKVINDYAWTVVKALLHHTAELNSLTARQLLADCLMLPIERPSKLYSALLSAAIKVATTFPEFRFAAFLRMWNIVNLRHEDHVRQQVSNSDSSVKSFPSLAEKTTKALAQSLLLHPEDRSNPKASIVPESSSETTVPKDNSSCMMALLTANGLTILQLIVTRIKQTAGKDGRKYTFVTLTSPDGLEVETISHTLQPSPLHPLPDGKRHYVNIGQLYDCLLSTKSTLSPLPSSSATEYRLSQAFLSQQKSAEVFSTAIGYLESTDQSHGHMHIYDSYSRHFVAPIQRISRERVGDFVQFIPIIPVRNKFKTAIILTTVHSTSEEVNSVLREIRITHINKEKGYAAWELVNKEIPITESLSPLQLSQGESSPTFTTGYLNLATVPDVSLSGSSVSLREGWEGAAFIYLRRGKDRQKRPHVAKLFDKP